MIWIPAWIGNHTATILEEIGCDVGMPVDPKIRLTQELWPVVGIGCNQAFRMLVTHVIQRRCMVRNDDCFAFKGLFQLLC
ncbi:hypothetical protein D3C75_1139030 [compost metagenome]